MARGYRRCPWIGFASLLVAVCASGVAVAKPAPAPAAPRRAPPERVYVVVFGADGLGEADRRDLEDAVARGARGDGSLVVATPDRAVGLPSPDETLTRGDEALTKAREKIAEFELGDAIELLERAAEIYRDNLPDLALRDDNVDRLFAVYRELAVAQFLEGDEDAAGRALAHCLVLKPKLEFSPSLFPPQMEQFVLSAGLLSEEMGHGALEITVRGGPALVYVNGVERGEAPLTVADLPSGPTVVNAVGSGTPTATAVAEVSGGEPLKVELEVLPPVVAIPANVAAVRGDVGRTKASKAMKRLRKQLGVDALLVVVPTPTDSAVELTSYVYDLRTGLLAGTSKADDGVRLGSGALATADWGLLPLAEATPSDSPPIWNPKHKYFWHAVGAAAGVATIVTVGIVASRSGGLSNGERVVVFGLGTQF